MTRPIGIYEKATPKNFTWRERLAFAKELGFDFVEMSVDESDSRLARLDWTKKSVWTLFKLFTKQVFGFQVFAFRGIVVILLGLMTLKLKQHRLK